MTNDVADTNPEEAVPCFALSKNDSYVMSASGGKISVFNMLTYKVTLINIRVAAWVHCPEALRISVE